MLLLFWVFSKCYCVLFLGISHLFYCKENDWGFSHFISWSVSIAIVHDRIHVRLACSTCSTMWRVFLAFHFRTCSNFIKILLMEWWCIHLWLKQHRSFACWFMNNINCSCNEINVHIFTSNREFELLLIK